MWWERSGPPGGQVCAQNRMRMGKYPFLYIYFIYMVPDVNGLKLFASSDKFEQRQYYYHTTQYSVMLLKGYQLNNFVFI